MKTDTLCIKEDLFRSERFSESIESLLPISFIDLRGDKDTYQHQLGGGCFRQSKQVQESNIYPAHVESS